MSCLPYFLVFLFTTGIYQSYGFLPFPISNLNKLRHTAIDTKYIKNNTYKNNLGPLPTLSTTSRPDLKRSNKPYFKHSTLSSKLKPYKTNRYINGRIKSNDLLTVTYAGNNGDKTNTQYYYDHTNRTVRYLITEDYAIDTIRDIRVVGIARTLQAKELAYRTRPYQSAIRKYFDTVTIQSDLITEASEAHSHKTITTRSLRKGNTYSEADEEVGKPIRVLIEADNFYKATRSSQSSHHTASLLAIPVITDYKDSGKIGPVRILIKDDLDFEADYTSLTTRSNKIAFFDITEATVNGGKMFYPQDDLVIVTRSTPYDKQDRVTRTSQQSTVYTLQIDRNFQSSETTHIEKPIEIIIDDNTNAKTEYKTEVDFNQEEDYTVRRATLTRSHLPTKQDSWPEIDPIKKNTALAYDGIPETTSTQERYGLEYRSNAILYLPYAPTSTWPTFTIRNYFRQFYSTTKISTITSLPLISYDKAVTEEINILTEGILSTRSKKIVRPKLNRRSSNKNAWECYTCGMTDVKIKYGEELCYNVFNDPTRRSSHLRQTLMTRCSGDKNYYGQCFKRYLDVGKTYVERGCRSYPPATGTTYASKLFRQLEYLLRNKNNSCVASPHAILMPFSSTIQLYTRVHVCVCTGRYCNGATSAILDWSLTWLSIMLYDFIV